MTSIFLKRGSLSAFADNHAEILIVKMDPAMLLCLSCAANTLLLRISPKGFITKTLKSTWQIKSHYTLFN